MPVLIPYMRQSRKRERTISIEEQRRDIQAWAERANVTLSAEVVEQGVSGSRPWRERELGAIIEAVKAGRADGIVVAYQSRLSRESGIGTAEVWDALDQVKARLVCVMENIDTARGGEAEFSFALNAAMARREWQRYRENFKRGKHTSWEKGIYVGSAPAGYESPIVAATGQRVEHGPLKKTAHAEAVGQAITLKAQGGSWAEVARALTAAKVPTARGETRWRTQACRAVARNPILKGEHACTCGCGQVAKRPQLAVVTASTWDKAQPGKLDPAYSGRRIEEEMVYDLDDGIRRQRTVTYKGSPGRQDHGGSLLAGLLVCRGCGQTMGHATTGAPGTKKYRFYRCRGGVFCNTRASISAPKAEDYLKEAALEAFAAGGVNAGREPDVQKLVGLEQERDAAVAYVSELSDAIGTGTRVPLEALAKAQSVVDAAEAALLAEQEARVEHVTEAQVREAFERAPDEEQRHLLRLVFLPMAVTPGRGSVEAKIELAYRRAPRVAQ